MILTCDNKGCYAQDEHRLDESDNTVYCTKCCKPIDYPQTTKTALKKLGQVKRHVKKGLAFTCKHCKATERPELKKLGGITGPTIAVCKECGKQLDIPGPFIEAIKSIEETQDTDEE